ncbi:hypothetical protein TNCV_1228971 [Trichonephila clavipes]|nr:hypothetical protein TNCV_1228971 [Trichonephila clavipes]
MKLQKKRSGDQYSEQNDRKAGGGAYRHQCSCRVQNQQKCRFAPLKAFQTTGTSVRKIGSGRARTTTADRYIILQAKRGRRQSVSVIAQQLSTATGRQVSLFNVARSLIRPPVLNAASVEIPPTPPFKESTKTGQLINGVVSLFFTDESRFSTEAILNTFDLRHGFIPVQGKTPLRWSSASSSWGRHYAERAS